MLKTAPGYWSTVYRTAGQLITASNGLLDGRDAFFMACDLTSGQDTLPLEAQEIKTKIQQFDKADFEP